MLCLNTCSIKLQVIINEASDIIYSKIRLDSAPFAKEAQALYHLASFRKIEPYCESEIPKEYYPQWVFMELTFNLTGADTIPFASITAATRKIKASL